MFPVLSVPLLGLGPLGGGSETGGWETIHHMLAKHSLGTRSISTILQFVQMKNLRPYHRTNGIKICLLIGTPGDSSAL